MNWSAIDRPQHPTDIILAFGSERRMSPSLPVKFDEVHKRFKRGDQEITVVEGINIEIAPGEFVALMGPSGSGKSTLLNLVAGLDKPSSGRVTVGGFEPATMSDNELCHWRS